MNSEFEGMWEHIRELGLSALSHATYHAAYVSYENPNWVEFSVLQAAHAAELLLKARIAQEHPLLIFEQLPTISNNAEVLLSVQEVLEKGRTIQWSDLPSRLWISTGIKLTDAKKFLEFGKLRNKIQHFASMNNPQDLNDIVLEFIYNIIDPFINECWGLYAIDYNEDNEPYIYLCDILVHRKISFLVSPDSLEAGGDWIEECGREGDLYLHEQHKRIIDARSKIMK